MSEIPVSRRDFEAQLETLLQSVARSVDNPGSYKSSECERCTDCMFTTGSRNCLQCTYCSDCENCTKCTHCKWCRNCHSSSYCVESVNCTGSSYLIMSRDCHDCVFCFGCVGLHKKEFHILNQPFKRDEYFRLVKELKKTFNLRD